MGKKTGCDEFVEDQLIMALTTLSNTFLMIKRVKNMEDICFMEGFAEKNSLSIFSARHNITVLHTKIHSSQTPPPFFAKKTSTKI